MRSVSFVIAAALAVVLGVVLAATADAAEMKKSKYRGKWFDPALADCRAAIMQRESNFNYRAANRVSSARGAYRFLDNNWRGSLVHILRPEVKRSYPLRRDTLESLTEKSIHKWPAFYQDAAFYTVVVKHDGLKHWSPLPGACR